MEWQEQHEGKQLQDLTLDEQNRGDMRFVCEGCSIIVKYESDLEYVVDDIGVEYQFCEDCAK